MNNINPNNKEDHFWDKPINYFTELRLTPNSLPKLSIFSIELIIVDLKTIIIDPVFFYFILGLPPWLSFFFFFWEDTVTILK